MNKELKIADERYLRRLKAELIEWDLDSLMLAYHEPITVDFDFPTLHLHAKNPIKFIYVLAKHVDNEELFKKMANITLNYFKKFSVSSFYGLMENKLKTEYFLSDKLKDIRKLVNMEFEKDYKDFKIRYKQQLKKQKEDEKRIKLAEKQEKKENKHTDDLSR